MQVGDMVKVKPSRSKYGEQHPWKFEVGIVTNLEPWGAYPGKEAQVYFPSAPAKQILRSAIEVIR
jgi:hypothetical protein